MTLTELERTRIGEITLAHREWGEGEPVLLVHGALVADTMMPLAGAPALSAFRRIVYHRRGYGRSPRPDPVQPVTLTEHAEDALGLLDHVGADAAHVVGHSMGALIGLVLAARHPQRVRSLALLEPITTFRSPAGAAWLAQVMPLTERYARGDVAGTVSGFYDTIYQPGWRARMDGADPGAFEQSVRDAPVAFESDLPGTDWTDGLGADDVARIRCPVLSVVGTRTVPAFADGRRLVHDWFPWCQDADIEGGDHLLPLDRPDAVAAALARFLAAAVHGTPQAQDHHF